MMTDVTTNSAAFQAKDWITLCASLSALFFSILTYRQKSGESRLSLRKQLTELLEKLTDLNLEAGKYRNKKTDYPTNYLGLLNDQRRFFIRQAEFVAEQIPALVSPYEYLVLAGAFDETDDTPQADKYFNLAIASTSKKFDQGIATRGYGRFLFVQGNLQEARLKIEAAIQCFVGEDDRSLIYTANSYERWAALEDEWGDPLERLRLLGKAIEFYDKLSNPTRRSAEVSRVRKTATPNGDERSGPESARQK